MKLVAPLAFGLAVALATVKWMPHEWVNPVAWVLVCACVALSVVDVLVWQIVRNLDDYVKSYEGPIEVFEEMLKRVGAEKIKAFVSFLVNFIGRSIVATLAGGVTAGKIGPDVSLVMLPYAVGFAAASVLILIAQCYSYFFVSSELAKLLLRGKRDKERQEELQRLAARPQPMEQSDEHTAGYTKVVSWDKLRE
jgi:hypothetical protein